MRLLEGYSTLYTSLGIRVSRIGAKLVCLSTTSKQAKVAPECCHAVQGWKWRYPLTGDRSRALGDSSVNYNLWNIVTTYLQEIPQRIR